MGEDIRCNLILDVNRYLLNIDVNRNGMYMMCNRCKCNIDVS